MPKKTFSYKLKLWKKTLAAWILRVFLKKHKSLFWNFILDLDANGKNEEVVIKSYPGFPGNQNTEVYINSGSKPVLTEVGSFYTINTHKMDDSGRYITELQLQTGQSLNTLFYTYRKGKLEMVPISTEKPSSWHGIISRNSPKLGDINNDGVLELLVHYNFLYDPTRRVEIYRFDGKTFTMVEEYEEPNSDSYL